MMPGVDPKVDYAFKKIFGSEANAPVLLDLLHAVLKPPAHERIVALEVLNPFNDKETPDDKLSILDIKAHDQAGRQYNVEMQMVAAPVFLDRVLYYWAVLHGQQLREGKSYAALRSTISISFVNGVLFPQVPDYHLDFQLRSARHPELVFSGQQSMHVLELPKFRRTAEQLADGLDVWCYFLVHGAELDTDNLPAAMCIPAVRQAMEVLRMFTQDELERDRYENRVKAERDRVSFPESIRQQATAEGVAKGLAEGLAKGFAAGEFLGRIHVCQRMLKLPLTAREELLALRLPELQARAEALEQQLGDASS